MRVHGRESISGLAATMGVKCQRADIKLVIVAFFPNFYLARRRTQCLTSSYSGTAVGRILKTLIRPRRFNSRTAFCTAVLERPVPSESLCRLNRTRFCSAR